MVKIGINGFGRIGRMVLRVCVEKEVDVIAINDANMNADYMVYLFLYDSTHGRFKGSVKAHDNCIDVNGRTIRVYRENDPKEIPWGKVGAEYVVEATGAFTTTDKASQHFNGDAKKVIITAPSPDAPIFVFGVNLEDYNASMKVVSMGSCSANAAAPILKVLHDNFCVVEAFVTCIHSMTASQKTVDGPSMQFWRDGRGALQNIIPACSGSAKVIGKVLPNIAGRVSGIAFRVPIANVSAVDITVRVGKTASYTDIVNAIKTAACCGPLKRILAYTNEEVTSSDFINCSASATLDIQSGISLTDKFTKIVAWYDNEYAFAQRVVDMVLFIAITDGRENK